MEMTLWYSVIFPTKASVGRTLRIECRYKAEANRELLETLKLKPTLLEQIHDAQHYDEELVEEVHKL